MIARIITEYAMRLRACEVFIFYSFLFTKIGHSVSAGETIKVNAAFLPRSLQEYLCFAAVITLCSSSVIAQEFRDCSWAPDQVTASNCAHEGWKDSDAELNRLWGIVKPRADARGAGQALLNEQRQWLRFRDGTCEGERDQFRGGSIAPQVYWSCMDRLTRARNAQLWQLQ